MSKVTRNSLLIAVGAHTLLWVLFFLTRPAEGGIDQSPAFLFFMIIYWIDTPARCLLQFVGMAAREWPLLLAGTLQWALVAWALAKAIALSKCKVPTGRP